MNIVYSNFLNAVAPDTFVTFPGGGDVLPGPATLVWVVYSDIDADQGLRAQVYERSDSAVTFSVEDETMSADDSNHTGFQSTPVPLATVDWGTLLGVRIVGGTTSHDVIVVAIEL